MNSPLATPSHLYTVQIRQRLPEAPGYMEWKTVKRYTELAKAELHEAYIASHAHSLDVQIVTSIHRAK